MHFATVICGVIFAGIFASGLPNSERNVEDILRRIEKEPRISLIGDYTDPVTHIHKRYYIDSQTLTWSAANEWCEGLGMEAVAIQSVAEMSFLSARPGLNGTYYWTSGVQVHDYRWTLRGGSPINTTVLSFCSTPVAPICLTLHKGLRLHPQPCTSLQNPMCQLQS